MPHYFILSRHNWLYIRKWIKNRFFRKVISKKYADHLFCRIIEALNDKEKIRKVRLRKSLFNAKRKKDIFRGFHTPGENGDFIDLNASRSQHYNREEIAETLLHEVLHSIFPDKKEEEVEFLTKTIWAKLSPWQRDLLKSYIPKKVSN